MNDNTATNMLLNDGSATIVDSIFRNGSGHGLYADSDADGFAEFSGNTFSSSVEAPIAIYASHIQDLNDGVFRF